MVFLVILAGGVVRMTQSGMGCPDWPKCFGMWIPPTSAEQLPPDFEKYLSKQDIDHSFNVYHTWIEYINRLLGALLGIFIIIHFIWSWIKFRKMDNYIVIFSGTLLLGVIFQGWLGKQVVDANLEAVKVTIHMLMALVLAILPLHIVRRLKSERIEVEGYFRFWVWICILAVLFQILLGTQVREDIDIISRTLSYTQRELWIPALGTTFYIHRTFSWILAILITYTLIRSRIYPGLFRHRVLIAVVLPFAMITGLVMNFLSIPAIAQPLHLLLAAMLFAGLYSLALKIRGAA